MKKSYPLIIIALACLIYACKKSDSSPQALIVGKWTFQKQRSVYTLNDVKQSDTTFNGSINANGNITFGNNGMFTSAGHFSVFYYQTTQQLELLNDSTSGTYSINNNMISFGNRIAHYVRSLITFGNANYGSGGGLNTNTNGFTQSGSQPFVPPLTKVIQLTPSSLIFQTEYVGTINTNGNPYTYDELDVYYFTK